MKRVKADIPPHQHPVEPVSKATDVEGIMVSNVYSFFGEVRKACVSQCCAVHEISIVSCHAIQIGCSRQHCTTVIGNGRSYPVAACNAPTIANPSDLLQLWRSRRTASHHVIIHPVTPKKIIFLPLIDLFRE